jgi:hypothetical protein
MDSESWLGEVMKSWIEAKSIVAFGALERFKKLLALYLGN